MQRSLQVQSQVKLLLGTEVLRTSKGFSLIFVISISGIEHSFISKEYKGGDLLING